VPNYSARDRESTDGAPDDKDPASAVPPAWDPDLGIYKPVIAFVEDMRRQIAGLVADPYQSYVADLVSTINAQTADAARRYLDAIAASQLDVLRSYTDYVEANVREPYLKLAQEIGAHEAAIQAAVAKVAMPLRDAQLRRVVVTITNNDVGDDEVAEELIDEAEHLAANLSEEAAAFLRATVDPTSSASTGFIVALGHKAAVWWRSAPLLDRLALLYVGYIAVMVIIMCAQGAIDPAHAGPTASALNPLGSPQDAARTVVASATGAEVARRRSKPPPPEEERHDA